MLTRIIRKYNESGAIVFRNVFIHMAINLISYVLIVIKVNAKVNSVQKFFDTINEIDTTLQERLKIEPPKLKFITLSAVLVNFVFLGMNIIDNFIYGYPASVFKHIQFYLGSPWAIYNFHISEFTKVLIVNAILKRFRVFNRILDVDADVLCVGKRAIDEHIQLHRKCCDLVVIFNDIFGLHMLMSMIHIVMYFLRLGIILIGESYEPTMIWLVLIWMINAIVSYMILT